MMELLGHTVRWPLVGAPMAGGPSTPRLTAAVSEGGALGFLAGGYLSAPALEGEMAELRRLTDAPFGVNLFVPQSPDIDQAAVQAYVKGLPPVAGGPDAGSVAHWDDDGWSEKLELLISQPAPVVSFTFGCPAPTVIRRLHQGGSMVVVTVTTPAEASHAVAAGADAVAAQGIEAGGHQGSFDDDRDPDTGWGLLALLTAVRHAVAVPVIAAGGVMTGADVAAVVSAGAVAAQLGTALLRSPESGASQIHKSALVDPMFTVTAITRAFSGRRARGLLNDFMRTHPDAPSGYPHINNATRALRREAVARGDPHGTNLWAGQGFRLSQDRPAAEITAAIGLEFESRMGGAATFDSGSSRRRRQPSSAPGRENC